MSYATVMVHVDVTGEIGAHVKVAAALADRFRARLIGITGWAPASVFLAEEALQEPILSTPPLQEMKSILDVKGQQFETASAPTAEQWNGDPVWIFHPITLPARRVPQIC